MTFDIILFIIAAIGFVAGFRRGIIYMLFFLVALFLGVFASLKFNYLISDFLFNNFSIDGPYMPLISLIITFVLVFSVITWLAELITKALQLIFLNGFNRLFGGLLGALGGAAIVSIGVWYLNGLDFLPNAIDVDSKTFSYCMDFAPIMIEQLGQFIPYMSNLFEQLELLFEQQGIQTV